MGGGDVKAAKYEVFEVSPAGTLERLCARLASLDDAKQVASLPDRQTRVILYKGRIVWPCR